MGTGTAVYEQLDPADLLRSVFTDQVRSENAWQVRWDGRSDVETLVRETLPPVIDFHTSGTTGASERWQRTLDQMWTEAGMLADLVRPARPQGIVSFAPPRHVYGALATVLMPARLGLPVWYRPQFFGAPLPSGVARWAVVAVPWTFAILDRNPAWTAGAEAIAVLHSSAAVPATAGDLLEKAGGRLSITEIFGSTEAGGIATRQWDPDNPPWTLLPDVTFAAEAGTGGETPLAVRSPRLATRPGEAPVTEWRTDDFVEILGPRSYRFAGRRGRLAKINGRRVHLDELEDALRPALDCADLAFLPVADDTSGEHLDLFVVPRPLSNLSEGAVFAAAARVGARPRRVFIVDGLDRTTTGKLRLNQSGVRP
jgi:acyl-coenzyme A synthetase/AMP-(fatty) acid ligase